MMWKEGNKTVYENTEKSTLSEVESECNRAYGTRATCSACAWAEVETAAVFRCSGKFTCASPSGKTDACEYQNERVTGANDPADASHHLGMMCLSAVWNRNTPREAWSCNVTERISCVPDNSN